MVNAVWSAQFTKTDYPLNLAYNAIYLEKYSSAHLQEKLAEILGPECEQHLDNLYLIGPGGIRVRVNDQVMRNIANDSVFACEHDDGMR